MPETKPITVAHITHEAVLHMGGIGTVLEGLHTAAPFRRAVGRSILVGPLPYADAKVDDPVQRLGPSGVRCHYSGVDKFDSDGFGALFKPLEWAFGVSVVYGVRRFGERGSGVEAEVVLIDVSRPTPDRINGFKWTLFEKFGIDSRLYEHSWDFEEYVRLAEPAYHALCALMHGPGDRMLLIAHEFMGLPTALRCALDRRRFRTAFHAHECSTARRLVESLPGHDLAFYPAMRAAMAEGKSVEEVFGPQADFARHALVSRAHRLDGVLAVGPATADELRFLSPEMRSARISVAYNGVPSSRVTAAEKLASRRRVLAWLRAVAGQEFDFIFTHVTRPVISKGLWRDAKIGAALEPMLAKAGKRAAYILLTCGADVRTREQVNAMARAHAWPLHHRDGWPDLAGPETGILHAMGAFAHTVQGKGRHEPAITPILVNQFGFDRERLGDAAPSDLTIDDLRRSADVELGPAVYEPFGISPLEPLHAGAVCVVSSVSGCLGLAERAMKQVGARETDCPVLLRADFLSDPAVCKGDPYALVHQTAHDRDAAETRVCARIASEIFERLPADDRQREKHLALGQALALRMSWEAVCESDILPAMHAAMNQV